MGMMWRGKVPTPLRTAIFLLLLVCGFALDPYRTLGLDRRANTAEIKKAHRRLAKEYHPDKNSDPAAEKKFLEISDAYDILVDDEKRRNYDRYGDPEGQRGHTSRQQQRSRGRNGFNAYSYYQQQQEAYNQKLRAYTTQREWDDSISLKLTAHNYERVTSALSPLDGRVRYWLIYVFAEQCALCESVSRVWEEAAKHLRGFAFTAKIHADFEANLVRNLNVRSVPTIFLLRTKGGVSTRKEYPYRTRQINKQTLVDWVAHQMETETKVTLLKPSVEDIVQKLKVAQRKEGEKVHLVVFSKREKVHVLWKWLAEYLKDDFKIFYGCLDSMDQRTRASLPSLFNVNQHDIPLFNGDKTLLVIQREKGTYSEVVEYKRVKGQDRKTLLELLMKRAYLNVPNVHADNYFNLCFMGQNSSITEATKAALYALEPTKFSPPSESAAKVRDEMRKSSYRAKCVIFLVKTHEQALQKAATLLKNQDDKIRRSNPGFLVYPLTDNDNTNVDPEQSKGEPPVQLAWMDPKQQAAFVEAVLLAEAANEFRKQDGGATGKRVKNLKSGGYDMQDTRTRREFNRRLQSTPPDAIFLDASLDHVSLYREEAKISQQERLKNNRRMKKKEKERSGDSDLQQWLKKCVYERPSDPRAEYIDASLIGGLPFLKERSTSMRANFVNMLEMFREDWLEGDSLGDIFGDSGSQVLLLPLIAFMPLMFLALR